MHTRTARIAALLVCLALLLAATGGCQRASTPADTLARFQDAYNRLDLNAMLDCFQPAQANAMRSMINIAVGLTGLGVSGANLINILPLFFGLQGYGAQGESFQTSCPRSPSARATCSSAAPAPAARLPWCLRLAASGAPTVAPVRLCASRGSGIS